MRLFAECINPDAVIITNIGDAHSEGFSSMEEKANEKALLTSASNANTVIYIAPTMKISTPQLTAYLTRYREAEVESAGKSGSGTSDIRISICRRRMPDRMASW